MTSSNLSHETHGDVCVLILTGTFMESDTLEAYDAIRTLVAGGARKFAADLQDLKHLSSSCMGMLVRLHKELEPLGGRLVACCLGASARSVFAVTRLDAHIHVFPSRTQAVAALA